MKRYNFAAIAALLFLVVHTNVFANENYAGGGVGFLNYKLTALEDTVFDSLADGSVTALYGRLGTHVNDHFSVEGRLGSGLADEEKTIEGVNVAVKLNSLLGVYGRFGASASGPVSPYVIAGFTRIRVELAATVDDVTTSTEDTETDSSFGVGIDFKAGETGKFNIEYMNYYDNDGDELGGVNISYVHNF